MAVSGLCTKPGQLVDEPIAAFLDYLVGQSDVVVGWGERGETLLVIDLAGGNPCRCNDFGSARLLDTPRRSH